MKIILELMSYETWVAQSIEHFPLVINDLDSIHFEINRIYEQWDEGEITYESAMQKAKDVCNKFIKFKEKV